MLGLITRNYGQSGTGVYTLALTYIIFFYLIADLSLNNYYLTKYSKTSNDTNYLFSIRILWSVFLIILANLLVYLLPFNTPLFQATVLIGSLAIFFSGIATSTSLIFQANLKYQYFMLATIVGSLTMLITTFIFVMLKFPTPLLILGVVVGWTVNNLISLILANKLYTLIFILPKLSYLKSMFIICWPLSATLILNTIYFRVDSFILTAILGFEKVAIYNLAYSIFQTTLVIPTFIMNSFYPLMIAQLKLDRDIFNNQIKKAGFLLLALSLIIGIGTWFFAPTTISLIAGKEFKQSSEVLQLLTLSIPAFFLSSLFMWTLMTLGRFKNLLIIYGLGLLVNLVLNLWLIPNLGIRGAIFSTIISEYLILVMQVVILWRMR